MKTLKKYWPMFYAAFGHPWLIGIFSILMVYFSEQGSNEDMKWYIAAIAFLAAGTVRK